MAHLWFQNEKGGWEPDFLKGDFNSLTEDPLQLISFNGSDRERGRGPLICRGRVNGCDAWVLLVDHSKEVWVNGQPVFLGLRILQDKDELRMNGASPMFFSSEQLPKVEPYEATPAEGLCPRCKRPLQAGQPAVRCPQCKVWCHQQEKDFPCWTYSKTCALCNQPTDLHSSFRWTPDER